MATRAAGSVQAPKGSASGVGGPVGAVATNTINLGDQLLNIIGPRVNGGVGVNPPSPLAGKAANTPNKNLPTAAKASLIPLVAVLVMVAWIKWGKP